MKRKPIRIGRPSFYDEPMLCSIAVRCDQELLDRLERFDENYGNSLTDIARRAVFAARCP